GIAAGEGGGDRVDGDLARGRAAVLDLGGVRAADDAPGTVGAQGGDAVVGAFGGGGRPGDQDRTVGQAARRHAGGGGHRAGGQLSSGGLVVGAAGQGLAEQADTFQRGGRGGGADEPVGLGHGGAGFRGQRLQADVVPGGWRDVAGGGAQLLGQRQHLGVAVGRAG